MSNFLWKLNRLKAMNSKEILYRVKKELKNKRNKIIYKNNKRISDVCNNIYELDKVDSILNCIWGEKNNITLNGEYKNLCINNFGLYYDLNKEIDWHQGTEGKWNENKFSLEIDTKNTDTIGDIRCSWEINRMQFLPCLAILYNQTGDEKYIYLIKKHFYGWINKNNILKGINWLSPMEIAIRSYQWMITYYFINDNEIKNDILNAIIISINYVSKNLSSFSSANNHLILEAFIISEIGYILKDVYNQNWFKLGYDILKEEIKKQNNEDGINKEHALHYQAFVTDAILQYNFFLKNIKHKPVGEDIIKKSLEYMSSLKVDKLNFEYGDSDDARIIQFSFNRNNYYKYLLELGSIYYNVKYVEFNNLFSEVKFISKIYENNIIDKYIPNKYKIFDESGYCVISSKNTLLFDFADVGFGKIAAHGHSDALSIIYYYNDKPVFVDSGTYVYNIQSNERNYFRSTEAHNTLIYNNKNQSEIKGPFLWGRKAKSNLEKFEFQNNCLVLEAIQDGYFPFIHKRKIKYDFNDESLEIIDEFPEKSKVNFILDNNVIVDPIDIYTLKLIINGDILCFKSNIKIHIKECYISNEFTKKIKTKKIELNNELNKKEPIINVKINKLKEAKNV